jgi:cytochrome P450
MTAAGIGLLSHEFLADPYPVYLLLRESPGQLVWLEDRSMWLVPGHAAVSALLRDKRVIVDPRYSRLSAEEQASEIMAMKSRWILRRDGSYHSRLKRLQSAVLAPHANTAAQQVSDAVVAGLLAEAQPGDWFDVMATLALDLPYLMISTLLGVRGADQPLLRTWSRDLFATLEPGMTPAKWDRGEEAARSLRQFFADLLAAPAAGGATLMAQYQRAIADGTAATDEIEATCALMFVAGHETTSHFLGNAITALARHPDQLAVAARVGGFTTAHVSELLRFDGSVQNTSRVAATDLTVGDEKVGAGARLLLLLGSANRDEAAFPAGDRLDLDRSTSGHLALGLGPHYCPGAWLAQEQTRSALNALLRIGPRWTVDEERIRWRQSSQVRGPEELWLRIDE